MEFEVAPLDDERSIVRLKGRLDSSGVDQIETRFTAAVVAANRHAAIDLSQVDFLASMGIRLLISTGKAMQLKGRRLGLFGATEAVQGVLDAVALDQLIPVVADEQQALAAIAG